MLLEGALQRLGCHFDAKSCNALQQHDKEKQFPALYFFKGKQLQGKYKSNFDTCLRFLCM